MGGGIELRVYLPIPDLGRQFAAYLGTPLRARGYPPIEGDHALIVEVAPGLAIERIIDLALSRCPTSSRASTSSSASSACWRSTRADPPTRRACGGGDPRGHRRRGGGRAAPALLYVDVIEDVTDQHAVIVNRNREASMLLPGQTLLVVSDAGAVRGGRRERGRAGGAGLTLVTVSMIGAAGRVYLAGTTPDIVLARDEITRVLEP